MVRVYKGQLVTGNTKPHTHAAILFGGVLKCALLMNRFSRLLSSSEGSGIKAAFTKLLGSSMAAAANPAKVFSIIAYLEFFDK